MTARQVVLVFPLLAGTQDLLLTTLRHTHFQKHRPIGMIPQMTLVMPDSILSPEWKAGNPGLCSSKSFSCQRSDIPDGPQEIVPDEGTSVMFFFLESQFRPPQESFSQRDVCGPAHCSLAMFLIREISLNKCWILVFLSTQH